jgi:hypothetical protein
MLTNICRFKALGILAVFGVAQQAYGNLTINKLGNSAII